MRQHLCKVWERYKEGKVDFISSTMVTTAAIHSIKDLEEDLALRCPLLSKDPRNRFNALKELYCSIYEDKFQNHRESAAEALDLVLFSETNRVLLNFANHCLAGPLTDTPKEYSLHLPPSPILASPSKLNSTWTILKGKDGHAHIDPTQIIKEETRLSKLVLDYAHIHFYRHNFPSHVDTLAVEDIISQGLKLVLEQDKVTIWTTLACRVLLDVQNVLELEIESIYETMLKEASDADKLLDLRIGSDNTLETRDGWDWHFSATETKRARKTTKSMAADNPFTKWKKLWTEKSPPKDSVDEEGRIIAQDPDIAYYFKQNILYCGTMRLSLALDMQLSGIGHANTYAAIFVIAHLYNAAKQLKETVETHPELEQIILVHKTTLFGSEIPGTPRQIHNCFLRKIGMPAKAWARDKRASKLAFRLETPMLQPNQAFNNLRKHYFESAPMAYCLAQIRAVGEGPSAAQTQTPVQMLAALEKRLPHELTEMQSISHLALSRKCIVTLKTIRSKLEDYLEPEGWIKGRTEQEVAAQIWKRMAADVLQGAADELEARTESMSVAAPSHEPPAARVVYGTKMLDIAAGVIGEAFAERVGE